MKKTLLLVFICLILVSLWFSKGLLFAGGEEGIPFYNLVRYYKMISSMWYGYETGGLVIGFLPQIPYFYIMKLLSEVGISGLLLQALTFFILMIVGVVSIYYLIRETVVDIIDKKYGEILPFIAAIFYLLNPFSLSQIWGRGLSPLFFPFACVPLFLLLFVLSLKRSSVVYLIFAELLGFIFSPAFSSPTQALVVWFPVLVYLVFYLTVNREDIRKIIFSLLYFVLFFVFWLLIQSWWLLPNFSLGGSIYSTALNSTQLNVEMLKGLSSSYPFNSLIRLMQNGYFFDGAVYGDIYASPYFLLLSWSVPIISLFSLSKFRRSAYFKYYLSLFLISLFVCLGANPPFGRIFIFFFRRIVPLQAFRNPFEKFGIVFLLSYVPFFSIGLIVFSEKIWNFLKRRKLKINKITILAILMFLLNGIYIWPMWTGQFAGGIKYNPWIKVPDFYQQANDWLNNQKGDFRLLHVPLIPGDGSKYDWEDAYQGVEPSRFLFDRESISTQTGAHKEFYNILLGRFGGFLPNINGPDPDLSKSDFRSKELYQELSKLNVRYIILHRDLLAKLSGATSFEDTKAYLDKQPNIKKVQSFGNLDIYGVEFPKNISIIYSPQTNVQYTKLSPTQYNISVKSQKDFDLNFLTLYDPGWELYSDGEKIDNHFKIFSYANAWKIKKGDFHLKLYFKPQESVDKGVQISLYTIIALLAVLLGYFIFIKSRFTAE